MTETTQSLAQYWESRYAEMDHMWSGRVNQVLADVVSRLVPGSALDLGCGEGCDAVWLASKGWEVTGIDLSPTALRRARQAATDQGITEDQLHLEANDLATWEPVESFDLVTCSFLHSWPVDMPREDILRKAPFAVTRGGHILVISHAAAPSWSDPEMVKGHVFPTPEADLAALNLDPSDWSVVSCEIREREGTSPSGQVGMLIDGVVLARRK